MLQVILLQTDFTDNKYMANYRQQTAGVLGSSLVCAPCYDTLTLCYSTVAQDLCCGSPTSVTVYVNAGETLATATNLYSDTALTTVATAGYYSDDTNNCGLTP